MRMNEVATEQQLREFMATPTDGLVEFARGLEGDFVALGVGGKVGPELVETLVRADRLAGVHRTVHAASRFSDPSDGAERALRGLGVVIHKGDLSDRAFLDGLPDAPNIVYMAGVKFGSSRDWRLTFHMNCIMPYLVGERFGRSRIVAYSSGNPYPHSAAGSAGPAEDAPLAPHGVYAWSIVAREAAFQTTAARSPGQEVCLFRLQYAQHLAYGVLIDLARMVQAGEPVSLAMPAVNLVSQRDAIDVSLRALGLCANPPSVLNCAGPALRVREVVEKLAACLGRQPRFAEGEGETAALCDDALAVRTFGPYRDAPEEMIEAAARWVAAGGAYWGKPTLFGRVRHEY
jgi:hypothetical protein